MAEADRTGTEGDVASSGGAPPVAAQQGSAIWLALTRIVLIVAGFGVQMLLWEYLGEDDFGLYSIIVAAVGLFGFLAHLEMAVLLARQAARNPDQARSRLGRALGVLGLTALPTVGLIVAYIVVSEQDVDLALPAALAAVAAVALGVSTLFQGVLQGLRRMRVFPVATLTSRGTFVGLAAAALLLGGGLSGVFLAQIIGYVVMVTVLGASFIRHVGWPEIPALGRVLSMARESVPFGLNRLYGSIYLQSDLLIVGWFHSPAEAGIYYLASLVLVNLAVISGVVVMALYPALSRDAGNREAMGDHVGFALRLLLLFGVPAAVGGMLVAEDLLGLFFDDSAAAVPAMIVLLPVLCLRFMNHLTGMVLSATDRQDERTRTIMVAAAFNVVANLIVVPFLGAFGAACTTLVTESLLAVWLWVLIRPEVARMQVLGGLARIGLGAVVMAAVVVGLSYVPVSHGAFVLVQVGVGGAVYVVLTFVLRAWSRRDLGRLRRT